MAVRDGRGDVKQTTVGFRVHSRYNPSHLPKANSYPSMLQLRLSGKFDATMLQLGFTW